MKKVPILLAILAGFAMTEGAMADAIPYPSPGTPSYTTYNFTAGFTGTETLYIQALGTADFADNLYVIVGGGTPIATGLNPTSPVGTQFSFAVTAGESIVFELANANGQTYYSNALATIDGVSHVYSTPFSGGGGIPAGTYVGFEDNVWNLPGENLSDFKYQDLQFVFAEAVPEASTWVMLVLGFAGLGFMGYRRSRNRPVAVSSA